MADQLIRGTAADNGIRIVGVITTKLTQEARDRHKLSAIATAALGRTMAAGLLMSSSMKKQDARINLQIKGDGPLGGVLVDAGPDGTVRGYVSNPHVKLPPNAQGKLDVGGAIGQGFLHTVKDFGHGYPYSSTVELVSGEIGDDITHYLATSEQTPSALALGVFVDSEKVTAAGGLLLQILPKAARDETLITKLESRLGRLSGFTPLLQQGKSLQDIFEDLLGDEDLHIFPETQLVRFDCSCTFERMMGALGLLGKEELLDMIETDGGAEATCNFCGEVYHADVDHLKNVIAQLEEQQVT